MANYYGTTVCEGGKIKPENKQKVQDIVDKWNFGGEGDITVEVQDELHIYGYDDLSLYKLEENGEDIDFDNEVTEEELTKLCLYMETPLIIKSVGNEKCRYVGAFAWIISKDGVKTASLDEAIQLKLK